MWESKTEPNVISYNAGISACERGEQWASECIDEALDSGLLARYWLLCPPAVLDIGIAHIPKLVTHIRCRDSIGRAAAARAPKEGLQ